MKIMEGNEYFIKKPFTGEHYWELTTRARPFLIIILFFVNSGKTFSIVIELLNLDSPKRRSVNFGLAVVSLYLEAVKTKVTKEKKTRTQLWAVFIIYSIGDIIDEFSSSSIGLLSPIRFYFYIFFFVSGEVLGYPALKGLIAWYLKTQVSSSSNS